MQHFQAVSAAAPAKDQGLANYMNRVYMLMSGAMALTGVTAYAVSTQEAITSVIYGTPLQWVVMLAPLGLVFFFSARIHKMSPQTAHTVFWLFAGLIGVSISYIFLIYTNVSIIRTFFITSCAFLGLSLYGYTTKRNLAPIGTFLVMGLIGLIIASVVNIFVGSSALNFVISVLGVVIFAGLTAWDTQKIKNGYFQLSGSSSAIKEKSAVSGALTLYLDFLNLFLFLLRFLGDRK